MSKGRIAARCLSALLLLGAGSASGTPTVPLKPGAATGRSTVEQRHVYAPPDEGSFTVRLRTGLGAPTEVLLEEPEMCRPTAKAWAKVSYSKRRNEVVLEAHYDGLPYRMSYTRERDVSTPYNQFPVSITEGKWQIWFVGRMLNFDTTFFYDATTLQLIGSEHDLPGGPPPHSIPVPVPTLHMLGTPIFEGRPDGTADVRFVFRYDSMLDEQNKGGVYFSYVPFNLCKPDELGPYYTDGGLPVGRALHFDQVLESIWGGYGMAVATSLEPDPKPQWLLSRDNTMITWASMYPMSLPPGVGMNAFNGTVFIKETCGTHVLPDYTPAYFNICAGR